MSQQTQDSASPAYRVHITVSVIIEHHGRLLMVEEPNEDQNNRLVFSMPTGHVDDGEDLLNAAIREAKEETGCAVVTLDNLVGIYDYVKAADRETILRFCFSGHLPEPVPETFNPQDPAQEIRGARWYTHDECYEKRAMWRSRLVGRCLDDYFAGQRLPLTAVRVVLP